MAASVSEPFDPDRHLVVQFGNDVVDCGNDKEARVLEVRICNAWTKPIVISMEHDDNDRYYAMKEETEDGLTKWNCFGGGRTYRGGGTSSSDRCWHLTPGQYAIISTSLETGLHGVLLKRLKFMAGPSEDKLKEVTRVAVFLGGSID